MCDLSAVYVKEKRKVSPSPSLVTICPALSPSKLVGDIKPKIMRDDPLASAPISLFDRTKPLKIVSRRPPGIPGSPPYSAQPEFGISNDTPFTPVQVAAIRAERSQRDNARTA